MTNEEKLEESALELADQRRAETARADAAERMLVDIIKRVNTYAPGEPLAMCLIRDVPGLREWYGARNVKYSRTLAINAMTAKIAHLDAERERVARELAGLEGRK